MSARTDPNNLPAYAQGPRAKLRSGMLSFYCPACKYLHMVCVDRSEPEGKFWMWNGDLDHVTLNPSAKYRTIDHSRMSEHDEAVLAEQTKHLGHEWVLTNSPFRKLCHFEVTNGKIRFSHDSTHHLAALTVGIPEF